MACREEGDGSDQELLRKALQDKAALHDQVQQLRGQVCPTKPLAFVMTCLMTASQDAAEIMQ